MARRTIAQVETEYSQRQQALLQENGQLSERLAALEMALETADWRRLTMDAEQEFSRDGLRQITKLTRIMALKNPLVKRGVEVQRLYVWGQGWSVKAADEDIDEVLTSFFDDPANVVELGHQALGQKETELQVEGNLFFVFFPNAVTGRVRVRSIPFDEIESIVCNPEDRKETWYYRRQWTQESVNVATGAAETRQMAAYYPCWRYTPTVKPATIGSVPVRWESPLYHIRGNAGYSNWMFGLSEIYASIDWARAYKEFLEDWASIVRAYRRFAFQLSTPGGKQGIAAAKAKLGTTYGNSGTGSETNPPPVVGSTFITGGDAQLTPVRTSGATVSAEDGRRMLLMVAASVGLPETFFGDVSVGTLATAESLDRPTELAMKDRQTLWADIYNAIFDYVLLWAVKAPQGPLRGLGMVQRTVEDGQARETVDWNAGIDPHIDIDFPPIIAGNMEARIRSIVSAATLDGKAPAGTLDLATVARLALSALGEDDIDELMARLFPDGVTPAQAPTPAEEGMIEALRDLKTTLVRLQEATA